MDDMPLPELQYNVRLLVDEAEAEVVMLDGRLR
jgi:tuftelin-interacting protein 11